MTTVTVRDIPPDVRDELAARAARAGRSLQEHLRIELIELASRPSATDWLNELASRPSATDWLIDVRRRKAGSTSGLSREQILSHRDTDRR